MLSLEILEYDKAYLVTTMMTAGFTVRDAKVYIKLHIRQTTMENNTTSPGFLSSIQYPYKGAASNLPRLKPAFANPS